MFRAIGRTPIVSLVNRRHMNVHEYSAKQFLKEYGCLVETGYMCQTLPEVQAACDKIPSVAKVVKSQILAGGRGKGHFDTGYQGGVKVTQNAADALEAAKAMLGNVLITKQTGAAGQRVSKLFITEAIGNIKREVYLALLLDRASCSPMFIGSAEGGMNIEQLAAEHPDKIKKLPVNIFKGIDDAAARNFAQELGFTGESIDNAVTQIKGIYRLAKEKDATLVEINPLGELADGRVMCLDAKIGFDDNASFRRPEVWAHNDPTQQDAKEVQAAKFDLNYVALDGNVGCLVNGAGLAMATMDIVSLYGARPANFLDVGGSAKTEQIVEAFKIITLDKHVKCVLVNIFGGIMKCDTIAKGIVEALTVLGAQFHVPLVVRLSGTNEALGRQILSESKLAVVPAKDLDEAGRTAAELANKAK